MPARILSAALPAFVDTLRNRASLVPTRPVRNAAWIKNPTNARTGAETRPYAVAMNSFHARARLAASEKARPCGRALGFPCV